MRTFTPRRRPPGVPALPQPHPGPPDGGASVDAPRASYHVYQSLLAAWQRRDAASIAAHFAAGGSFRAPGSGGRISAPRIAVYAQDLFSAVPDFRLEVTQVDAVADCVVDQWVLSGCWLGAFRAGPLAGLAPTGRSFALQGIGVIEVEDGWVRAASHHWDQRLFLLQVGAC